jgi:transcriptional regulator GlxA family with amidase domain
MLLSGARSLPSETMTPTHDRRLLLVLELINENIRRQFMIRELAPIVNLSPGRLAHLFKSEVGVSPQRYANNVRLEKAKELLQSGVLSVKEISSEIGFPNVSSFCRSFKARYRTTPREYRNIHLRIDLKRIVSFDYSVCLKERE